MNVFRCGSPMKTFFMGALLIGSSIANARYAVMDYLNKGLDPDKRTHIIVAAKGSDMGLQFHMSAAAQARKIQDVNPNDQVALVAVLDDASKSWLEAITSSGKVNELRRLETSLLMFNIINSKNPDDMKKARAGTKFYNGDIIEGTKLGLQQWGFRVQQEFQEDLDGHGLIQTMSRFNKIASLNVYSHSNAYYGLILDGPMNRLDPADAELAQIIRPKLTSDAYAWLHGCNNSIVGMKLTTTLGIPVSTSFTSTAFQELFKKTDGQLEFVHDYPGYGSQPHNVPAGARRVGVNSISYARTQECLKVPCVRMRPDNHTYNGYWGNFADGGLGFYKFTCSPSQVDNRRCKMGMARGLINQVNNVFTSYDTDMATFKKAAIDHLCPTGANRVKSDYSYQNCAQTLERALTDSQVTLDTFKGKSLQCSRASCNSSITCQESIIVSGLLVQKSCTLKNRTDQSRPITTQVQEYRDLVEGFIMMKQAMGQPIQ